MLTTSLLAIRRSALLQGQILLDCAAHYALATAGGQVPVRQTASQRDRLAG